jgi:hypothetical protein
MKSILLRYGPQLSSVLRDVLAQVKIGGLEKFLARPKYPN